MMPKPREAASGMREIGEIFQRLPLDEIQQCIVRQALAACLVVEVCFGHEKSIAGFMQCAMGTEYYILLQYLSGLLLRMTVSSVQSNFIPGQPSISSAALI
jgi:hypothetical protein